MSGGIAVRAYRVEDEEAVVALWADVFGYEQARNNPLLDVRRKRDAQPEFFLLAEEGGRVVGTVMGGYDGHRGWAHRLAVAPAQRRRGIGEALMRRLEAELDVAGCPKLNLQVHRLRGGRPRQPGQGASGRAEVGSRTSPEAKDSSGSSKRSKAGERPVIQGGPPRWWWAAHRVVRFSSASEPPAERKTTWWA
jgi:GNAT superfamily N-acetyltransferase